MHLFAVEKDGRLLTDICASMVSHLHIKVNNGYRFSCPGKVNCQRGARVNGTICIWQSNYQNNGTRIAVPCRHPNPKCLGWLDDLLQRCLAFLTCLYIGKMTYLIIMVASDWHRWLHQGPMLIILQKICINAQIKVTLNVHHIYSKFNKNLKTTHCS